MLSYLKQALLGLRQPLKDLRLAAIGSEWFEKEPGAQDRLLGAKDGSKEHKDRF